MLHFIKAHESEGPTRKLLISRPNETPGRLTNGKAIGTAIR